MARAPFAIWLFLGPLTIAVDAWMQGSLFRHQFGSLSFGSFTQYANHQLAVTKLKSFALNGPVNCALRCIGEPQCLSFNLAVHPDSDGLYQCDLLATDKYRATAVKDFQASDAFHHYSPWVNIIYDKGSKSRFLHHDNESAVTTYFKILLNSSFFSLRETWLALLLFYLLLPYAIASSFVAFKSDQGFGQAICRHLHTKLEMIQSPEKSCSNIDRIHLEVRRSP